MYVGIKGPDDRKSVESLIQTQIYQAFQQGDKSSEFFSEKINSDGNTHVCDFQYSFKQRCSKHSSDRMEIIKRAFVLGLEIVFHSGKARLFKAGQVACTAGGYFAVEKDTLMRAEIKDDSNFFAYLDDNDTYDNWNWLHKSVDELSHESVAKIAAACSSHSLSSRHRLKTNTSDSKNVNANVVSLTPIFRLR